MANKFQKSVQERIEQEAKLQKKIAAKPVVEIIPEAPTEFLPIDIPVKEISSDIASYVRRDTERTAKNKTFYLDVAVIEALRRAAKAQGVTDSKLCNDILRRVLSLD